MDAAAAPPPPPHPSEPLFQVQELLAELGSHLIFYGVAPETAARLGREGRALGEAILAARAGACFGAG